jgi:bifunctional non-homologous end joining protein LigD
MAAIDNDGPARLGAYRAKRSADRTPEPFSSGASSSGRTFVVQKHAARRVHYDFRIEYDGVLRSWAVPRGPSNNPADKRLAVQTEDHPVEYADFEGIIPEDNYGAGAVIVWDQGFWVPRENMEEGFAKGKLLFELHGHKLRGVWTLVRIKKSDSEWLLIKERDAWATDDEEPQFVDSSVFSGLLVEELRDRVDFSASLREDLIAAGAEARAVVPKSVELMKAQIGDEPFTDENWLFELKYDGYRLLAVREGSQPLLLSRRGHDITATFPEVAKAVVKFAYNDFIMDGEVVVHDEAGRPSFQRMQKRGRLTRRVEIMRAAVEYPAAFYAFDLLAIEGYDLRNLPLTERKEFLHRVLPAAGWLKYSDHVETVGQAFFEQVEKMKLEGIVAKRKMSTYRGGRSADWLKIRLDRTADFVVVGFSDPKGSRSGVGSLHLAAYDGGSLVYAGSVGTGFKAHELDEVRMTLETSVRETPVVSGEFVPSGTSHHWVTPALVVEVRYKEWPETGLLRHPVFHRFRDDKPMEDCVRPGGDPVFGSPEPLADDAPRTLVPFTNLDKIFWPAEQYTKGDLIEYYRSVAQWILPYLADRPVVMTRYPDGIDGKSFFQKDAPEWTPDWIRKQKVWSEDSGKETSYFICDDVETLLYIINMGCIPLHIWSSRLRQLEKPDWTILDLDPKEAPFEHVVEVALVIRELCERIGLPSYVKTSGSSGMHVLVPLGRQCTYAQSKSIAELLARVTASQCPDIATVARALSARKGRVYIDFVQNGHGKLLVSPLCVRPIPGAPVSMPLTWADVNPGLKLLDYTLRTAPAILRERDVDPMVMVIDEKPDLSTAIERLSGILTAAGSD